MSSNLMEEMQRELDMANIEINKLKRRLTLTTKYKDDKKKEAKKYFDLCKKQSEQIRSLEEQLKNGTHLKYKVGQKVWFIYENVIDTANIEEIDIDEEEITCWLDIYSIGFSEDELFATREEAEKRLADLKGESNGQE